MNVEIKRQSDGWIIVGYSHPAPRRGSRYLAFPPGTGDEDSVQAAAVLIHIGFTPSQLSDLLSHPVPLEPTHPGATES